MKQKQHSTEEIIRIMRHVKQTISITGEDAFEVGFRLGEALGAALEQYITKYMARRADSNVDFISFRNSAIPWFEQLPNRFHAELSGLSEGTGIPLQRIAEWAYFEVYLSQGCSSVLCQSNDSTWLAHNNDTYVPDMWGHITVRHIATRIPTMCFGLAGDIWTTAGINKAQLWLHIDHLSVSDSPRPEARSLPTYGLTVEALETCESISDVADLLRYTDREDGMILVVVDGKSDRGLSLNVLVQTLLKYISIQSTSSAQITLCQYQMKRPNWMIGP